MAKSRTIRVCAVTPEAVQGARAPEAVAWIVRVEGHEFIHGHDQAMTFQLPEDAAQFVLDLQTDYGTEVQVQVVGLDDLGLPTGWFEDPSSPSPENAPEEVPDQCPRAPERTTPREERFFQVATALFLDQPASFRLELILGILRHDLLPRHVQVLQRLDAGFVLARFKAILSPDLVEYAAWLVDMRRLRRVQT